MPQWVRLPLTHLFSCTSWIFSMPMALLRREPKGPDFFLVGLFPGTIRDCGERLPTQCLPALECQWPHLPLGPCHRALKPIGYKQERTENVLSGGLPEKRADPERAGAAPEKTHSRAVPDLSPRRAEGSHWGHEERGQILRRPQPLAPGPHGNCSLKVVVRKQDPSPCQGVSTLRLQTTWEASVPPAGTSPFTDTMAGCPA